MTQLRPYKFLVTPVVQQVDENGDVTGEGNLGADQQGSPFVVFGVDALTKFAEGFDARLEGLQQAPA